MSFVRRRLPFLPKLNEFALWKRMPAWHSAAKCLPFASCSATIKSQIKMAKLPLNWLLFYRILGYISERAAACRYRCCLHQRGAAIDLPCVRTTSGISGAGNGRRGKTSNITLVVPKVFVQLKKFVNKAFFRYFSLPHQSPVSN